MVRSVVTTFYKIVKYSPIVLTGLMAIHCFATIGDADCPILKETFNTPPLLAVLLLVFSIKFGMCMLHQLDVIYCYVIHLCIFMHEHGYFIPLGENEDYIRLALGFTGLMYFSTDDSMDGAEVLEYYRTRFQLEFCFRDSKQHTGITNCQSTDFRKLAFHFNASLTAINLAKAACKRLKIPFSVSTCKSVIHNAYMLERFICVFGIDPDIQVIDKLFKELILFTARAA